MPRPHKTNPRMTGAGPVKPAPAAPVVMKQDQPSQPTDPAADPSTFDTGTAEMLISQSTPAQTTLFDWVTDNLERTLQLFTAEGFHASCVTEHDPGVQVMKIEATHDNGRTVITINRNTYTHAGQSRPLDPMNVYRTIRYLRAKEGR